MPIYYPDLSDHQRTFINANHKRMSIRKMALLQHTCPAKVRQYMIAEKLPIRKTGFAAKKKDVSDPAYFDWRSAGDWIIGRK